MEQAEGGILMRLPAELRDRVYYNLLIRVEPCPIRVPRRRTFGDLHNSDARGSILYVSRQVHLEAIHVFFAHTTFIVGNGVEDNEASLRGLKCFIKNIPKGLLAYISHLRFHVYLRVANLPFRSMLEEVYDKDRLFSATSSAPILDPELEPEERDLLDPTQIPFDSGELFTLGSPAEAFEIRQIHQLVDKYFTGITSLTIDWITTDSKKSIQCGFILPKDATINLLTQIVLNLMEVPRLRKMCIWEDECVYSPDVVDRVMLRMQQSGKHIRVRRLRYREGIAGRIRREVKEQREVHVSW